MNSSYPWNSSNISKLLVIIFSLYSKNLHRTLVVISVCSKMASRKIGLQNRAYSTLSDFKKRPETISHLFSSSQADCIYIVCDKQTSRCNKYMEVQQYQ